MERGDDLGPAVEVPTRLIFPFSSTPPSTFDRRALAERLTALAQQDIWIGTSSWKYEGWLGQIYSRDRYLTRGRFSKAF